MSSLPQLGEQLVLADGGLETWLIEHAGQELPDFAAFPLLRTPAGRAALLDYYVPYLELAARDGLAIVLDTATWRASPDWGARLGFDAQALAEFNGEAVALLADLRANRPSAAPAVISGCVGPRYEDAQAMTAEQARDYHGAQLAAFAAAGADLATAVTMATAGEAAGIALAASEVSLPVAISFTTGADGRLPDGTALGSAIALVDEQTDSSPVYYLVNCTHPSSFLAALDAPECRDRIRGVRANAARLGADGAEALPDTPDELGRWYRAVRDVLPNLTVAGGCCGTDVRHVAAISTALRPAG